MSDAYFDELKRYINFTEDDVAHIVSIKEVMTPYFDDIVHTFYQNLWHMPQTQRLFENKAQVNRLKLTLKHWLGQLFEGDYGAGYFEQRKKIGRRHVDVGLLPHFVVGAMNGVRGHIHDILEQHHIQIAQNSMDKILDIELAIMLQSYHDTIMSVKLEIPQALASGLAHEVRNPLNALALHVTLLDRRLSKHNIPEMSDVLDVMRTEIGRIKTLTKDIMDFAKPIIIRPVWYDMYDLVNTMITIFAPTFQAHRIVFEHNVQANTLVWFDVDRVKQLLINLINNAIESTTQETTHLRLEVDDNEQESTLRFSDNGPGMTREAQRKAFDLFYTTKTTGTGMGLPIAKKIMDTHGGQIILTSSDQGTNIALHFPKPIKSL